MQHRSEIDVFGRRVGIIRLAVAAGLSLGLCQAQAVTIEEVFFLRDNQDLIDPVGLGGGDSITGGVWLVDPSGGISGLEPVPSLQATPTANHPDLAVTTMEALAGGRLWQVEPPFQENLTVGSDWVFNVNGQEVSPERDLTGAGQIPLSSELQVVGRGLNATFSWTLPAVSQDVPAINQVQIQLWNTENNTLVGLRNISPAQTNISVGDLVATLPAGDLAFRVVPMQVDEMLGDESLSLAPQVSRSSTWLEVDRLVAPVVVAQSVELTTASPAMLTQTVDTDDLPFVLGFNFRFETDSGELTVLLNDQEIGGPILAPSEIDSEFTQAYFRIDNLLGDQLLGLASVDLTFRLDGPMGSRLLLNNVFMEGLRNGDFEDGLRDWRVGGDGSAVVVGDEPAQVPEPTGLSLLAGGVIGLCIFGAAARRRELDL